MKSVVNYVVSRLIVPLSSQKKEKKKRKDLLLHFVVRCGQSWSLAKLGCCVRPCKWKGGWSWLLDLECEAMIKKQNNEMVFKLNREKKKKKNWSRYLGSFGWRYGGLCG